MRTRPFAGDQPSAAALVWLSLDAYEVRPFSRIVSSLLSTRLAQVGRAWKQTTASQTEREAAWRRARKWADVTTSRGLSWLTRHGRARKVGSGYLRYRPQVATELTALMDVCVEVEQQLRGLRTIWSSNPNYPGKEQSGATREAWDATLDHLLEQLDVVTQGIKKRRAGRVASPASTR